MTRKITYTDEPLSANVIPDFLPAPEELVFREENVKVTLSLSKRSVDFFKEQAEVNHTHYQTMIRALLDQYTDRFGE